MDIQTIHESLVNGQQRQMVEQIEDYSVHLSEFFKDYNEWLDEMGFDYPKHLDAFVDMVVSYHRINR